VFASIVGAAISSGSGTFQAREVPASTVVQTLGGSSGGYLTVEAGAGLVATANAVKGAQGVIPVLSPSLNHADAPESDMGTTGLVTDDAWTLLGGSPSYLNGAGWVAVDFNELSQGYLQPMEMPAGTARAPAIDATSQTMQLLVLTDGSQDSIERVRTSLEVALPDAPVPYTVGEVNTAGTAFLGLLGRMIDVGIILCLVIAGCSLAVSVAGSLVERKRAFALLRLTGMPLGRLYRAVLLEAAVPLVLAAVTSAGVGFFVAALIIWNTGGGLSIAAPGASYYGLVAGGLLAALAIVGATLPLVGRMTEPQSARME
jgi:branched-subunit amino acid transport protein AzlD